MLVAVSMQLPDVQLTIEQDGHNRLERWSQWTKGDEGALGFPRIQPFTRLITPTGSGPLGPMPDDVLITDRAVCELRNREHSVLWRAIKQFYLRNDAITVSMRECSVSRAGYYRLVKRAQRKVMELVRAA
jgi:hypothetical protein